MNPEKNVENVDPEKIVEKIVFEKQKNLENLMHHWRNKQCQTVAPFLKDENYRYLHSQQTLLLVRFDSLLVKITSPA